MKKDDCYFLGKITRTHGLAGNVLLKLDTDQPELYDKLEGVFLEVNGLLVPFFVDKQQWYKADTKMISFKNSSEMLVEQSIGKNVFLPLSTLPKLEGKQFYYHEVIGWQILDEKNRSCGIIKEVNDQTAQHYFVLKLNTKDVVIPVIKDWITDVSREEKTIRMNLPEGLLEVFTQPAQNDDI